MQVYINNVPSTCSADHDEDDATSCDFDWLAAETPHVESVKVSGGTPGEVRMGDEIEFTGSL